MFKIKSTFSATDDQLNAVNKLTQGIYRKKKDQVLLGVTGSGKTFTMANIIQKTGFPTLIMSHNKTLAGQLYQEMRDFFPENVVSYFVSYYDFYQPEAYIPASDTYIEKEAVINDLIDKLRLAATSNILTRRDVIVVASVSCIYNIGSPVEYGRFILELSIGKKTSQTDIMKRLVELQYERSEFDFKRGTFRLRGDIVDIYPAYEDTGVRVTIGNGVISHIVRIDVLTGKILEKLAGEGRHIIYPAKHYLTDPEKFNSVEAQIRADLEKEYRQHKKKGNLVEAQRLLKKVTYDLEMIKEGGYVNGIENYSRYFDGRNPGDPPYALLEYFQQTYGSDWLMFIDESHMTVPQIRGMYRGDYSRKKTLIDYGFRLEAALDNRPLTFDEFYSRVPKLIYVSATPNEWELNKAGSHVAEQLVRPTGIIDPKIKIKPSDGEIDDLLIEIKKRVTKKQRVLVTTLTKRIAEDLTSYLKEKGIRAEYLHSDIKTLERTQILHKLRNSDYDVLIGINLLREGLDLPEVTLVAILDAENEGFLRSKTALIQTMGRAARNIEGEIIIYADKITKSISGAVSEINRRRQYQIEYNKKHNIEPKTVVKEIKDPILFLEEIQNKYTIGKDEDILKSLNAINADSLTPLDREKLIKTLTSEMRRSAREMYFEAAILLREKINELKTYDR